uniref:C2 domain-containing protein n=1 Tax=Anopheles atroparvus TaxID=41427 RepID=A0A182JEI7_ANOAO
MTNAIELPASLPPPPPAVDDDPLRRAHKRISKMENLRRMSRLIESNQVLLNIYQQFNRTISEQPELPSVVTSNISPPLLPSSSLLEAQLPVTSSDAAPTPFSTDAPVQTPTLPSPATCDAQRAAIEHPKVAPCVASNGLSMPSKYRDSPRSDITENIRVPTVSRSIKHILRNRSFSETEFSERKLIKSLAILSESDALRRTFSPSAASASPASLLVKNASYKDLSLYQRGCGEVNDGSDVHALAYGSSDTLQKTVSESFLEQYSLARYTEINGGAGEVSLGAGTHASGVEGFQKGQNGATVLPSSSCESVASESSVVFSDLVPSLSHPVAGYVCVGLQFGHATDDGKELKVTVQEAKDLIAPLGSATLDTFVKVLLTPSEGSPRQTKVCKYTDRATYQETFSFWMSNQSAVRRSLWFYVYLNGANSQTMIGEAELQIDEQMALPITHWLKLTDSGCRNVGLGELMLSLSYLPTAERLTVVVVKARNLALKNRSPAVATSSNASDETGPSDYETAGHELDGGGNVFVKVYLLQNDRKISKKKTSVKRAEQFPIYNEAIIFSLPPYMLNAVQIRLSVVQMVQRAELGSTDGPDGSRRQLSANGTSRKPSVKLISLGHVIVGSGTTGKGLRHWHHMLTALRKPVTMWHGLRSTSERSRKRLSTNDDRIDVKRNPVDLV